MLCEYTPFLCAAFSQTFLCLGEKVFITMRKIPCLNSLKRHILVIFLPMHNIDNREVSSEGIFPDYPHEE